MIAMWEPHLRQAAAVLLDSAIRLAPPEVGEWGRAIRGELEQVEGTWEAVAWALGGATVLIRLALISLIIPQRRLRRWLPDGGLFAMNISITKAALAGAAACLLGALLFFAAPPFRQGMRVSLAAWSDAVRPYRPYDQPALDALARQAEARHDAEGLAFVAVRLRNAEESARLADQAVRLDPALIWIYAVVAVRHPDGPEVPAWTAKLDQWDPQNALFPLMAAESIDIVVVSGASRMTVNEEQRKLDLSAERRRAMEAAFASPRFDDYLDRLRELDRNVALRYRYIDPVELFSEHWQWGNLPTYAYQDAEWYAHSLVSEGNTLDAHGDRKGAAEKYWQVARFGQIIDAQARDNTERWLGINLQSLAYRQLQAMAEKAGNADEAHLFGYLVAQFDGAREMRAWQEGWAFGQDILRRNAAVLQVSSLLMMVFLGLGLISGGVLIAQRFQAAPPAGRRAQSAATLMALAGGVGFLLSSACAYLTYRPYWYIFQNAVVKGDTRQVRDLSVFLMATHIVPGVSDFYRLADFKVYFWAAVTLLGVGCLTLLLLRHLPRHPPAPARP